MSLVSVIIPTRNRRPALERALASVEAQTVRDREIIVIDDGSTDGTSEMLAAYADVKVLTMPDVADARGASAARNAGLAVASGEFLAFLDDDDVWSPLYLERQVGHLESRPDAGLSYADHVEIGPSSSGAGRVRRPDTAALLNYRSTLVRLLAESFIHTMSVVVCRRRVFDTTGLFATELRIVHDLDWYVRALGSGHEFVHLDETLVGRAVPGGLVTREREWRAEEAAVLDRVLNSDVRRAADRRLVRSYRALFFAYLAMNRRDWIFGLSCLATALSVSPFSTVRIGVLRLARRLQRQGRADLSFEATAIGREVGTGAAARVEVTV
ncbi:MAG: glycosyltransferase [Gemmatimonadota bacterium]